MRTLYRVRQFWYTLNARPSQEDLERARRILSPDLMALFRGMQPSEQAHSLSILNELIAQGETQPDLLVAALLHDVGKSRCPLTPWERVAIVLGKALFPEKARRWGWGSPGGWRRPFVVAEQHAAWGAQMAAQAGASPLAVRLIRQHQDSPPGGEENLTIEENGSLMSQLLVRLQALDNNR